MPVITSALEAAQVKARAGELGFDLCGIARAHPLDPALLDRWLAHGWDAELPYVRERRAERLDPSLLVPGAASVIVVASSYAPAPGDPQPAEGALAVARHPRRPHNHTVVLKPPRQLTSFLRRFRAQ